MAVPNRVNRGYLPFNLILNKERYISNKCLIEIKENKLYVDDIKINSFLIKPDKFVIIKGQHFTSREAASQIRTYRRFIPTGMDDYTYFAEDGFYSLSKDDVKHTTGASSAEIKFDVEFSVEARRIWIKVEKRHPVKFAVENGLRSNEIISLTLSRFS